MIHFRILFFSILFTSLVSEVNGQERNSQQQPLFPVVVSFFSIGGGTNKIAHNAFEKYVENFEKKHHVKLNRGETHWGREGEIDYCFELKVLSARKKVQFIKGIKEVLGKAPQVKISENAPCLHQR